MRASHQAGLLVLQLQDDGAGVDLERLRRNIVERKLSPAETAAQLSEEELLTFLFLPGFSLRDKVTEVSGRGVGLDAVQHMVRQLHGAVSRPVAIRSEERRVGKECRSPVAAAPGR